VPSLTKYDEFQGDIVNSVFAAMLTKLDVIDSAVKIGLGAFIGIFGSFIAAKQKHSLELRKEALRRRQDALERIVEDFEAVQKVFVDLNSSYGVYIEFYRTNETVATLQGEAVHKLITTDTLPALQKLHNIEGRLRLFGLKECAHWVGEYRYRVTQSQELVTLEPPFPTDEALRNKLEIFANTRLNFYHCLAEAHSGTNSSRLRPSWMKRIKSTIAGLKDCFGI
jgi:hypothetical protein